jgi:hypothetical protein
VKIIDYDGASWIGDVLQMRQLAGSHRSAQHEVESDCKRPGVTADS